MYFSVELPVVKHFAGQPVFHCLLGCPAGRGHVLLLELLPRCDRNCRLKTSVPMSCVRRVEVICRDQVDITVSKQLVITDVADSLLVLLIHWFKGPSRDISYIT